MASTPTPTPTNPASISIKAAARKLPIKRKSPDSDPSRAPTAKPPPFKFHRIWTETDELGFLQGLLDSASHGLLFPRDLPLFYARFSSSTPQPYTRPQLSEKLRRLRKKFRAVSSRISRGLDQSLLSLHDRALFDLSKRLWAPEFAHSSPFNGGGNKLKGGLGSRVRDVGCVKSEDFDDGEEKLGAFGDEEAGLDDGHEERLDLGGGVVAGAAVKAVMDVFDECLNEARAVLVNGGEGLLLAEEGKGIELMRRWREQRVAELEALARRLRLVLENSIIHDQ